MKLRKLPDIKISINISINILIKIGCECILKLEVR